MHIQFDIRALEIGKPNIFDIPDADKCVIGLYQYFRSHSTIVFQLHLKDEKKWYLTFEDVRYYQGKFGLRGAAFYISPLDELADVLFGSPDRDDFHKMLEELATTNVRLFTVGNGREKIQIVASAVSLTDYFEGNE